MAKKMTAREKKLRAEARAELREAGILPPKKVPLNRRKFANEVMQAYLDEARARTYEFYIDCLPWAITIMLPCKYGAVTPEEVGALKIVKIAMEMQGLITAKQAAGEPITYGEIIEKGNAIKKL